MEVPQWEGMAPHQVGPLQQGVAILPQQLQELQWVVTPSNHLLVDILPRPHPLEGRAVTPSNHLHKHQVATPSSSHHQWPGQLQRRPNQLLLSR